jgi:tetraacyldisaccharide 4'-kinase
LERDLNVVLLDAHDPWGGGALLPAGRMREPHRALQRADVIVITQLAAGEDPASAIARVRPYAPAADLAAARHRITGITPLAARADRDSHPRRFHLVTATGAPHAVERSARELGLDVLGTSIYRDHHWFTDGEVRRERKAAQRQGAEILLTRKDAVRWPTAAASNVWVLEATWEWLRGGDVVLERVRGSA